MVASREPGTFTLTAGRAELGAQKRVRWPVLPKQTDSILICSSPLPLIFMLGRHVFVGNHAVLTFALVSLSFAESKFQIGGS